MKRRVISLILVLCMVFGNLPAVAFAAEEAEEPAVEAVEVVSEEAEKVEETAEKAVEGITLSEEVAFNEGQAEYVTASVSYTAQLAGAYLCAPQTNVAVRSDLAESYGYTDSVAAATAVSALDVLVAAHELAFAEAFKESPKDLLTVAAGSPTMQFGVPSEDYYGGFMVNHALPNDGTKGDYGYNGTTVGTQAVQNGDLVEFFFYEDEMYCDTYNWFTGADGTYARSFTVEAEKNLELDLQGLAIMMYGFNYKDAAEMVNAKEASAVEDAQIYLVNKTTGELTPIEDAVTDEDGHVTLSFAAAGTYTIAAYGTEDCNFAQILSMTEVTVTAPAPKYTVKVAVAPSTAAVTFYEDEALTTPLDASAVSAIGVASKLNNYTLTVPAGTYWYAGTDGALSMGSGSIKVTGDATVRLVRHNFYSANANTEDAWTITALTDKTDSMNYTPGAKVLDGTYYKQFALLIGGHKYGLTYTIAESMQELYYVNAVADWTPSATATSATNKTFGSAYHYFKLTVPADAETVTFYQQTSNYVVNPMSLAEMTSTTDDAGTTYYFKSTGTTFNGTYSYRVSKAGSTTLAGYMADKTAVTLAWSENAPNSTVTTAATVAGYDDNAVLLNIDDSKDTNELSMQVGDTFKLRAFRGPWQIIDTTTANHMIEPDFHYSILSGSDVISVEPVTVFAEGTCSGNAKGNWMNITALAEGTAVLAVWYDGIEIASGTTLSGFYGATDPARYGYVVVNVGADATIAVTPVSQDGDWDAEFDTVYYTGSNGEFVFTSDAAESVTVTNLNGTSMGSAVSASKNEDGQWVVPVTAGSNLIAVTGAAGTDYRLVRAARVKITFTNKSTGNTAADPAELEITAGDTLSLHFEGLHMPIPKMSGIYNPGYMGTAKSAYVLDGTYTMLSTGTQYDFVSSAKTDLEFKVPTSGEHTLSGFISLSSMGDAFGNHRNITDAGRTANMNAAEVFGSFGTLPEFTFTAKEAAGSAITYEEVTGLSKVGLIIGGTTAFNNYVNFTAANANNTANWKTSGWKGLSFTVTPTSFYNSVEARYWYEGDEPVTVPLTPGVAYVLDETQFTVDTTKVFNIEIIVTPGDPSLGAPKVYSYVVMGGTANLKYVHPIITGLTIKDDKANVLKLYENISYTKTDYELPAGGACSVSLEGTMLQKVTSSTANTADKADTVVIQRKLGGQNVGDPITVAPDTENAYPTGKWSVKNLDLINVDTIEITVTSYADPSVSRVYTIAVEAPPVVGKVHVVVENTTFTEADPEEDIDAPAWTGTLIDTMVDITNQSTMMSAIVDAIESSGYTQTGAESNYISTINGLSEFDGGFMSGWMGTLNDWFTDKGFNAFTVNDGGLKDGDEIRIMYTCEWGVDLGADWSETSMALKDMTFSAGTLSPAFDSETTSYTLDVAADVATVEVLPTAVNKNNKVVITVGGNEYTRGAAIPVVNGMDITVTCGSGDDAVTYTVTVKYPHTPITAYVNASSGGVLLTDKDGNPAALMAVELDTAMTYTIDDVLVALHEQYAPAGAGFASSNGFITKFWGVENGGNYGFWVNNASAWSLNDAVVTGDIIDVFIYNNADLYYYENYSAFTTASAETTGTLTLKLLEYGYDASWNIVPMPCEGATITIDGERTEYVTDADGKVTLTFTVPGEHRYIVSAEKTIELDDDTVNAITAPICVVTANVPLPRATAVAIFNGDEQVNGKTLTYDIAVTNGVELTAAATPDAALQQFTWKSSNTKIATVDENGHVTFVKNGTVKITATAADGSKKAASVTLKVVKLAHGIEILDAKKNPGDTIEVVAGKSLSFKYRFLDENDQPYTPTDKNVDWSIVDGDLVEAFATVKKGKLTTKRTAQQVELDVQLTVRATGASDTVHVVILPNTTKNVEISDGYRVVNGLKKTVWLSDGTTQLTAEVLGLEDTAITWKTSNKKVATVENGVVTLLKTGTVKITAVASDGKTKAVTTLKVIAVPDHIVITSAVEGNELVSGKRLTLKVNFLDADDVVMKPTSKKVVWSSSDPSVATVKNGVVTAAKRITEPTAVTITVTTTDGSERVATFELVIVPVA